MPKNANALDANHWIWAKFDEHNVAHFGGRLPRPGEILRMTSQSRAAQVVNAVIDGVACRMIWIDGDTLDTDRMTASDSLLHEMIHYELAGRGDPDIGHGLRFVARANEIGKTLGLSPCDEEFQSEVVTKIASVWPVVQRAAQLEGREVMKADGKRDEGKRRRERNRKKAQRRARR